MSLKYAVEVGSTDQSVDIQRITNEAFIADTFFKKPQYHLRFDLDTVKDMISSPNGMFLVAKADNNEIAGSIYLQWEVYERGELVEITGKFSAVSVPPQHEKKGIGKALVKGAENKILSIAKAYKDNNPSTQLTISLQMGVINLRKDLFPWYESQGFQIMGEIRPNDPEVELITLDELKEAVCCILMKKELNL